MPFQRLRDVFQNQYPVESDGLANAYKYEMHFFTDNNGSPGTEAETLRTDFQNPADGGQVEVETSVLGTGDGFYVAPNRTFETPQLDLSNEPNLSSAPVEVAWVALVDRQNLNGGSRTPYIAFAELSSTQTVADGALLRVNANNSPPETRFEIGDPSFFTSDQSSEPLLGLAYALRAGLTSIGDAPKFDHLAIETEIGLSSTSNPTPQTFRSLPLSNASVQIDPNTGEINFSISAFNVELGKTGTSDDFEENPIQKVSLHLLSQTEKDNGKVDSGNLIALNTTIDQQASVPGYVQITGVNISFG